MIENPNSSLPTGTEAGDYPDEAPASKVAFTSKSIPSKNYDAEFDHLEKAITTVPIAFDMKLRERQADGSFKVNHYTSAKDFVNSPTFRRRILEAKKINELKELNHQLLGAARTQIRDTKLRESIQDPFTLGLYPDEVSGDSSKVFPLQDTVLPSTTSPYAKQMFFSDYMDMHRKAWEASVRNPLAKRIVKIIPQFVLGKGVKGRIKDKKAQDFWDSFWQDNGMRLRMKMILKEILIYGEVFLRYFRTQNGLSIRSIDPSTIWDVVTNPDDIEDVYYYHQQYVIINRSPIPNLVTYPSTLVIRQIPPQDIDHFRINSTSSEKRGRSEIYAILSWLVRYKEFSNDRVLLNKIRAMFALDVAVEGTQKEVDAAAAQFTTPPGSGTVFVHNKSIEIDFKNTNASAQDAKTDLEMLLSMIAVGSGISRSFLGDTAGGSRASALIQTEPDVKNFEDYQEIVDEILTRMSLRVINEGQLRKKIDSTMDEGMEFHFPALASEQRTQNLKDIAFMESMDYFSKRRAAELSAREFQLDEYDYDEEQQEITSEDKKNPVISQSMMQVPKIGQPKTGTGGPGGGQNGNQPSAENQSARPGEMGFPGDKGNEGRNLPNTKATLNRPGFTRGGEAQNIAGDKSSGVPKMYEAEEPTVEEQPLPTGGWSPSAREASIVARRLKRKRQIEESMKLLQPEQKETKL